MNSMARAVSVLALSLCFVGSSPVLIAGAFFNGGFETGVLPAPNGLIVLKPGQGVLPGWSVTGSVDWVREPFFNASEGVMCIDLTGDVPGAIYQVFDVLPFTPYKLTFDMSGNPDGGEAVKDLLVTVPQGGLSSGYSFTQTAYPSYVTYTTEFITGNFTSATITFSSLDAVAAYGPLLDNVNIEKVPEPGGVFLSVIALLGFAVRRRTRPV